MYNNLTLASVKTGKSVSRVTVYGGNISAFAKLQKPMYDCMNLY